MSHSSSATPTLEKLEFMIFCFYKMAFYRLLVEAITS